MNDVGRLRVRVHQRSVEADGISGFELVSPSGDDLPAFTAGSHIDVTLPNGLTRQYSLCNVPSERNRYVIGVLKDPASRGGSVAMHEMVYPGAILEISPPKNHFPLFETADRSLLFAGGIGVTPIISMAEHLAVSGADFEMHYCTRSPQRTAYLARLNRSSFHKRVSFHFDDGTPGQRLDLASQLRTPDAGTHIYVCGPSGFLDAVRATARDRGWSEPQIHYEYFSGVPVHSASDRGFEVQLGRNGRVVRVEAAQSIVEALAVCGVTIPVSCQQGVCGTCLTRVLEGEVDHKDLFLTPQEHALNDQFLPCCSRALSRRLVLDL